MANSFQKLADILNIETARLSGDPRRLQLASQMQEQKELKQATAQSEAEINKAIDESNLPESQKRLLKALSLREKAALFLETQKPEEEKYAKGADDLLRYTTGPRAGQQVFPEVVKAQKPEPVPADIQKLERFGFLKSKLDEDSPNYDPTFTPEMLNQFASILGVNAQLLDKSKNQFIADYMKEKGKLKTFTGQMAYSNTELKAMAEEAYGLIYGDNTSPTDDAVNDAGEPIIDLGSL
jgi:hypothetical protein